MVVAIAPWCLKSAIIEDFEFGLPIKVIEADITGFGWVASGEKSGLVSVPGVTTPNPTRFVVARNGPGTATKVAGLNGTQKGFSLEADFVAQFDSPNISLAPAGGSPTQPTLGPSFGMASTFDFEHFRNVIRFFIQPPGRDRVFSTQNAGLTWVHLRLVVDPTAFDGDGAGFVFAKERFPDGQEFAVAGLQNVPLGFKTGVGAAPGAWSMVQISLDRFCLIDNIEASTRPVARLWALETTQSIQDWFNSVPLISGKETYVRAFLEAVTPGDVGRTVTGRLRGFRQGAEIAGSPLSPINGNRFRLAADATQERKNFNGSLNFELPRDWATNSITLQLELDEFAVENGPLANQGGPQSGAVTANFQPSGKIRIGVIPMTYSYIGQPSLPGPSNAEIVKVLEWIRRMYPVAELDVAWSPPVSVFFPGPPGAIDLFSKVASERLLNTSWISEGRIGLGFFSEQAWQASLAGDIAGMGGALGIAAGWFVAGVDNVSGFQTTAAHELGHILGRPHPVAPDFIVNSPIGSILPVRAGACGEIAFIPVENFPFLFNVQCPGSPSSGKKATLGEMQSGEPRKIYGFEPVLHPEIAGNNLQEAVLDPECVFEMMSYCELASSWISKHTYNSLLGSIQSRFPTPQSSVHPASSSTPSVGSPQLLVSGTVDLLTGGVQWRPLETLDEGAPSESQPGAPFQLEASSATGTLITSTTFNPLPLPASDHSTNPATAPFFLSVPKDTAIRKLTLRQAGRILSTVTASSTSPVVHLTSPNGGDFVGGSDLTVAWTASDSDGDSLIVAVDYSVDDGAHWLRLASGLTGSSIQFATDTLPGSLQGRFRVTASDGFLEDSDISDGPVQIPDKGPILEVSHPYNGQEFVENDRIRLTAEAFDLEDGSTADSQIEWSSNRQGRLGFGRNLTLDPQTVLPGAHIISVTAHDATGHTTVVERSIQLVDITSPNLRLLGGDSTGPIKLEVVAPAACRTSLEDSNDLIHWKSFQSFDQNETELVLDVGSGSGEPRFFRAQVAPLPPQILQPPSSAIAFVGDAVALKVQGGGTGVRYRWLKNGSLIEGAINSTLVLTNLGLADSSVFQSLILNALGAMTSAPVYLTVVSTPYEVIHRFGTNSQDGLNGWGRLAVDASGDIYGCARNGGNSGGGVIFAMRPDGGQYRVLHRFDAPPDGSLPSGGVLLASDGLLYGVCEQGGRNGGGTVWRVRLDGGDFLVLHHFLATGDCRNPESELIEASNGRIYGTTVNGGGFARGGVFSLNKDGTDYGIATGFNFGGNGAPKGPTAGLVEGPNQMLFGTTEFGGSNDKGCVFSVSLDGQQHAVVANLGVVADGAANPAGTLLLSSDGLLYGTSAAGGTNAAGTVFRVAPDGTKFSRILSLPGGNNGLKEPRAGLVETGDHQLLGTTRIGGSPNQGGVFSVPKNGSNMFPIHVFADSLDDGARSRGPLLKIPGGVYYGTTFGGGTQDQGTVFRFVVADPQTTNLTPP